MCLQCQHAFDSVDVQSLSYNRDKLAMQATIRAGCLDPTPNPTSPMLLGDFIIARPHANAGVELYNVANLDGAKNPYAPDITFKGVLYEHVPNPNVSGLFGTFRMKLTLESGKRQQTRTMLGRGQRLKQKRCMRGRGYRRFAVLVLLMFSLCPRQRI